MHIIVYISLFCNYKWIILFYVRRRLLAASKRCIVDGRNGYFAWCMVFGIYNDFLVHYGCRLLLYSHPDENAMALRQQAASASMCR